MEYKLSEKYNSHFFISKIMGPNPLKLIEEIMTHCNIAENSVVMDLGSGQGLTSAFLAKEYKFRVFAVDLWSDPSENKVFFDNIGLKSDEVMPIKGDATNLPFAHNTFDAVICTDSYNYFGRDEKYLGEKLLPFVKNGGYIYITLPATKKDYFTNQDYPSELLLSWNKEQLEYIRDIVYWENIVVKAEGAEWIKMIELEGNEELWQDWIKCDNDYAKNDKKSIDAGACKYLEFIGIIIKKK